MRQAILVAGVQYHFDDVGVFRRCANGRRAILERRNLAREDMRFTTMDVTTGEVEIREITFASGKRRETASTTRPYGRVGRSSYVKGTTQFKPDQPTVMSILDVYQMVRSIGSKNPGTLIELSIFSHGWMGGPILVNFSYPKSFPITYETPDGPRTEWQSLLDLGMRDAGDKDGRTHVDFRAPVMDEAAIAIFRKAFHSDGISWLWGCARPSTVQAALTAVEHAAAYSSSGLDDDTMIELPRPSVDIVAFLEAGLAGLAGPIPNPPSPVQLQFKYLRYAFCRYNAGCYSAAIATATDKPVHAAPLGTWTEFDKAGDRVMHVGNLTGHLTFYKNHLHFKSDPEHRRYVIYRPGMTCEQPPRPGRR